MIKAIPNLVFRMINLVVFAQAFQRIVASDRFAKLLKDTGDGLVIKSKVMREVPPNLGQKVSLPPLWADNMLAKIESEREQDAQNCVALAQNLKQEIEDLDERLDKLLDTHLDGLIPKVEYAEKKQKILNHKIDVSEKLKDFEQKGNIGANRCDFSF